MAWLIRNLNRIASDKGLQLAQTLPEQMAGHLAQLNVLADHAFDLQYMRMMIGDHKKRCSCLPKVLN